MSNGPGPADGATPVGAGPDQGQQASDAPLAPDEQVSRPGIAALALAVGIPTVVAAVGVVALVLWMRVEPEVADIQLRLPEVPRTATNLTGRSGPTSAPVGVRGPDVNRPPGASFPGSPSAARVPGGMPSSFGVNVARGSSLEALSHEVPNLPGAWPRFRGAKLDNISTEQVSLATSWGPQGPKRLWSVQLGEGYAGPAVLKGRVYVLDYDQTAKADKLRCFALADGRELWSQSYPVLVKRNHGMSRTVPAVTSKYVVSLGPKCHVMCANAVTGEVYWKMDLVNQFGTKVPPWYAGQCPLIDGGKVILAPGGKALLIGVDLASGSVVWETPNPRGWKMTHSSVMPMSFAGQRMYVYCASGGVVGVSAKDGSMLWETSEWTVSTANVPTPVPVGDGRIFLCGGYNAGSMMLRLKKQGGKIAPEVAYRLKASVFASDQQTPILYKGHIYGVRPGGQLACLDPSGKRLWSSGSTNRFGLGAYMIAGGMIYVLNDDGELRLVKATPSGYEELAKAKVLNGPEAWGPMAIAGGRLLARDLTAMVCLDVTKS